MQDSLANLVELNPIINPDAVSTWPPAPGWYILFGLFLVGILVMTFFMVRKWRANEYRRQALSRLDQFQLKVLEEKEQHLLFFQINELLKRVAIKSYSRDQVASLSGQDWLSFLNGTAKGIDFTQYPGNLLADLLYKKPETTTIPEKEMRDLLQLSKNWIKKHRV